MAEKVGLEVILQDASFQAGLKRYLSGISEMAAGAEDLSEVSKEAFDALVDGAGAMSDTGLAATELSSKIIIAEKAMAQLRDLAKEGLELAQLGAMAERVEKRFAAFAGGVDRADALLQAFQEGAGGTVDKMGAMQSASKLLQMGLVQDADSMRTVVEMATRLGDQTMGATDRVSDFALMLANQSIPRLDNFGISSGKVRARIEELMGATEGMTREQAFMQATMEEGSKSLGILGDRTDDAAASFEKAQAKMKDTRVELGKKLAPILGDVMELIAGLSSETLILVGALGTAFTVATKFAGGLPSLISKLGMTGKELGAVGLAIGAVVVAWEVYRNKQAEVEASQEAAEAVAATWRDEILKQVDAGQELSNVLLSMSDKANAMSDAWNSNIVTGTALGGVFGTHGKYLETAATLTDQVNQAAMAATDSYEDYTVALAAYNGNVDDANLKVPELTRMQYEAEIAARRVAPAVEEAAEAIDAEAAAAERAAYLLDRHIHALDDWAAYEERATIGLERNKAAAEVHAEAMDKDAAAAEALALKMGEAGLKMVAEGLTSVLQIQAGALAADEAATAAATARLDEYTAKQQAAKNAVDAHALSLLTLAERLSGIDAQGLAREAIAQLKDAFERTGGDSEQLNYAIEQLQDSFELVTPQGRALTEGMDMLTTAVGRAIIPASDFNEALADLQEDAEDGSVDLQKLLDKYKVTPAIIDPATGAIERFGEEADEAKDPVNELGEEMDKLPGKAEALGPAFLAAGAAMVNNLKAGWTSAWPGFMQVLTSDMEKAGEYLPGSEPKNPDSPFYHLAEKGAAIVHNLTAGILKAGDDLSDAGYFLGETFLDALTDSLDEGERLIDALFEFGGKLGGIARSFLGRYEEKILDPLTEFMENLQEGVSEAQEQFDELTERNHEILGLLDEQGGYELLMMLYHKNRNALTEEQIDLIEEYHANQEAALIAQQQEQYYWERITENANEYAEALERAEKIQRAMADLEFLESQLKLLDLIAEYQLDPDAILGGLALGLDANLEDILDALTRAMQAIIAQTEEELEAGSPSRVFMRIGEGMMAGMAQGIQKLMGLPVAASLLAGQTATQAAALPAGGGSSYDYSRSVTIEAGGNTIGSERDWSRFDALVTSIVRRELRSS